MCHFYNQRKRHLKKSEMFRETTLPLRLSDSTQTPWLRPHVTALARQLGPGAHVRFWFDWLHFFPCPQRHCCRPEGSQQELRYFLGLLWPEKQVESPRCNVQYLKGLQERNRCSMSGEQILKQRNATDLSLFSNRVQDLAPLFSVHPY